jgi:hypothetical protein
VYKDFILHCTSIFWRVPGIKKPYNLIMLPVREMCFFEKWECFYISMFALLIGSTFVPNKASIRESRFGVSVFSNACFFIGPAAKTIKG